MYCDHLLVLLKNAEILIYLIDCVSDYADNVLDVEPLEAIQIELDEVEDEAIKVSLNLDNCIQITLRTVWFQNSKRRGVMTSGSTF